MKQDERPRSYDRAANQMRPVKLTRKVLKHAAGSCMAEFGDTHVLCAATDVSALLQACPGLTVLVTSRAVLRPAAAWSWRSTADS